MKKIEVSLLELTTRVVGVFTRLGVPQADAELVADSLMDAEICGVESHGLMRVAAYAQRLRSGLVEAAPKIQMIQNGSVLQVDGGNGLGQVVACRTMEACIRVARKQGSCFAAVSHSNHFGTAGYYTRMAAQERMIGFACTSAGPTMAPFGGCQNLLGTDPFSVAFPAEGNPPFTLDIAVSAAAKGKIRVYAKEGRKLPDSWAIDRFGNATTDPEEAISGCLLPMAGHKGYGMAIAIEALSSLLSGAKLSCEGESVFDAGQPAQVGHFMGVLDISHFISASAFEQRAGGWFERIRNAPRQPGVERILIPGELEEERRARAEGSLKVSERTYRELCALSEES